MSLVSRVQNMLLKPKAEWGVIDAEPATVQGIYTSYVMILAAIGPICSISAGGSRHQHPRRLRSNGRSVYSVGIRL